MTSLPFGEVAASRRPSEREFETGQILVDKEPMLESPEIVLFG